MKFFEKLSLRHRIVVAIAGAALIGTSVAEIIVSVAAGESISWLELPVGVAAALIVGVILAQVISKPIANFVTSIRRVRDGDYSRNEDEPENGGPVLREVAKAMNEMRERLRAGEEARQDSLRKSAAFEGATSALVVCDGEMRITHINEAFLSLFNRYADELAPEWAGRSATELIGRSMDVFHKKPEQTRRMMMAVAEFPFKTEIILPSDRISLKINTITEDNGDRLGYCLEWEAVTDRAVQAGLLRGMHHTQNVVHYDPSGRIIDVNERFCEALGREREKILGRKFEELIDPSELETEAFREFQKKIINGEMATRVVPRRNADGKTVWIDSVFNQIRDDKNRLIRMIEVGVDITEQRNRLNQREATLDGINAASAVIEFKPDGTIIRANRIFRRTMGYELHELEGAHHRLFAPDHVAGSAAYDEHWRRIREGETVSGVFERVTKSGETVYILGAYSPVRNDRGEVERVIKVVSNVTETEIARRKNEEQVTAAARATTDAVSHLGGAIARLAKGDLAEAIEAEFSSEYERLRTDFNKAVSALGEVVDNVVVRAESMKSGASEVSRAASDLSRRTESQAATLEETTASLKQLTETLRESAKSSDEANRFTASAADKANSGEDIMRRSLEAMRQIEESSSQISTIIGVIDDIAFQTNLLALNAGVEAARAGDAGRGFAVVASEVRALAQRSAEAARDIKQLISTSSVHVTDGVGLASEAGDALKEIITDVQRIKEVVSDLADSGKTQADNVSEIMAAMDQLDGVTQSNAAMVEEMTAASVDLTSEVNALSDRVAHFKTVRSGGGPKATNAAAVVKADPPAKPAQLRRAAPAVAGSSALKLDESDGWEEF